jgi:hypothetical protein
MISSSHIKMVNSGNKFKTVAGWNTECKEFHRIAIEKTF